jgi:hypothetical protein
MTTEKTNDESYLDNYRKAIIEQERQRIIKIIEDELNLLAQQTAQNICYLIDDGGFENRLINKIKGGDDV